MPDSRPFQIYADQPSPVPWSAPRMPRRLAALGQIAQISDWQTALPAWPGLSGPSMKNGLYSMHVAWLDGVRARASGVIILRDGILLGGDPYFWSEGTYTVGDGNWRGELVTRQHTPYADPTRRPVFGGREVAAGFSGSFQDDTSVVFATSLVGTRSVGFRVSLRKIADS